MIRKVRHGVRQPRKIPRVLLDPRIFAARKSRRLLFMQRDIFV